MSLELITPPASEPVTLDEAKAHLRVETADDDALITRLLAAAREEAERRTGRAFLAQSWKFWCDAWPRGDVREIRLPKPPIAAVTEIAAYDSSGTQTVLSNDLYIVDKYSVPGRVVFKPEAALPAGLRAANAVSVAFDSGYGANATDVPAALRTAILHLVAHLYESRGEKRADPPEQALALLEPYRVLSLTR